MLYACVLFVSEVLLTALCYVYRKFCHSLFGVHDDAGSKMICTFLLFTGAGSDTNEGGESIYVSVGHVRVRRLSVRTGH